MQALLSLEEYFVEEAVVRANPDYKGQGDELGPGQVKVDLAIRRKGLGRDFMISMKLELNKGKKAFSISPYYVFLDITGYFTFQENTAPNTMDKMIAFNGPAILYGVARGVVAQVTGNGRHGKYVLPTINFVELLKKQTGKEQPARQQKKRPSRAIP
jgi:preprotein translocase subunit SecB